MTIKECSKEQTTYRSSGRSHDSSLAGLSSLSLHRASGQYMVTLVCFTTEQLYSFECITHSGSLGSWESHHTRLASSSNRARGSRAAILSRGSLGERSIED